MEFLAFNLQTTGKHSPKIVTGSVVFFDDTQIVWSHEYLANPEQIIEPEATALHGITNEWATVSGRPHVEVVGLLVGYLNQAIKEKQPIVVFNARYDLTIIEHWATEYLLDFPVLTYRRIIDPLIIDRLFFRDYLGVRTLEDVAGRNNVESHQVYSASADAELAGRIWINQKNTHNLLNNNPTSIHRLQKVSYREWAETRNFSPDWPIDYALFQLSESNQG